MNKESKGERVKGMFGSIARRYDLLNHVLSLGMDLYWRWRLVREVKRVGVGSVLDLATGSGDVAFALRRGLGSGVKIVGRDFCEEMLIVAREKQGGVVEEERVVFLPGDCMHLPDMDGTYDVVTMAFGLRNLEDRERGLRECYRVLKGGGRLVVLEFSRPGGVMKWVSKVYLGKVVPMVGGWLSRDRGAYEYLRDSIEGFVEAQEVCKEMEGVGFKGVRSKGMTGGVVSLYIGRKG